MQHYDLFPETKLLMIQPNISKNTDQNMTIGYVLVTMCKISYNIQT